MDKKHSAHIAAYLLGPEETGSVDTRGQLRPLCRGRVESARRGQPAGDLSKREGLGEKESSAPPPPAPRPWRNESSRIHRPPPDHPLPLNPGALGVRGQAAACSINICSSSPPARSGWRRFRSSRLPPASALARRSTCGWPSGYARGRHSPMCSGQPDRGNPSN